MNILYVIVAVVFIYTDVISCNSTMSLSADRVASYCYYCATCPQPFSPNSPYVSRVSSPTGWCAMMSTSSSPNAPYTRGAAQPNLCSSNGCSWIVYGGVSTYRCCCNQNLCNAQVPVPTTPRPLTNVCYFCSNCPRPFTSRNPYVSEVVSNTGWCAKMSTSNAPDAIYTRGVAQPGICSNKGCSWQIYNGVNTWVCCCNRYRCNTGISTSKATVHALIVALVIIGLVRQSF